MQWVLKIHHLNNQMGYWVKAGASAAGLFLWLSGYQAPA
jgi:hypothetical protein